MKTRTALSITVSFAILLIFWDHELTRLILSILFGLISGFLYWYFIDREPNLKTYVLYDITSTLKIKTGRTADDYQSLIFKTLSINVGYHLIGQPSISEPFRLTYILYNNQTQDTKTYLIEKVK